MKETQAETARRLGYGEDVEAMNADHDPLHAALCRWLGVPSFALAAGRGEQLSPEQHELAALEEDAVLMVQRLMRAHGATVPR